MYRHVKINDDLKKYIEEERIKLRVYKKYERKKK